MKRIGIVTGGGDRPGLNAVIRAVAKATTMRDWKSDSATGFRARPGTKIGHPTD